MKGPVQPWQEEERTLLTSLQAKGALRLDRAEAWNAQAYLIARHVPLDLALATGVGYLEPGASERYQQKLLVRWEDRLLFPLQTSLSSDAIGGYAGRLLWHWQHCQDEIVHKQYLEAQEKKRWIKTNPAGWFWDPQHLPTDEPLVVVEGPFDRLATLAAGGFQPGDVMALVGTALQPIWLQGKIRAILLALDADQAGRDASQRIAQQLAFHQVVVEACLLPADGGGGKDWSERWRRQGNAGMEALYVEHALLEQLL
jgi:DNA primase